MELKMSPSKEENTRIIELDGLRGVALLGVVIGHIIETQKDWMTVSFPVFYDRVQFLRYCVDIFFVMSGFLVGGILFDHKNRSNFLPAFYARRAARILPLYYLLLAIAFLPILDEWSKMSQMSIPRWTYLVFIDNFWHSAFILPSKWLGILWTICIEEQFYLVAPLAFARFSARTIAWLAVLTAMGMLGLREFILLHDTLPHSINLWRLTFTAGDGLAVGVLGAWIVRQPFWPSLIANYGRYLRMGTFLAIALMLTLLTQRFDAFRGIGITIASLTTLMVILASASDQGLRVLKPLRWPVFLTFSSYSYFIFLFHQMVISLLLAIGVDRLVMHVPPMVMVALFFTLLGAIMPLAVLAKNWIENPATNLAKKVPWDRR